MALSEGLAFKKSVGKYTRLTNAPKLKFQRKHLLSLGELTWFRRRSVQVQIQRSRDRRRALTGNNVPDILGRLHHAGGAGEFQRFLISFGGVTKHKP
jgi:hypothetical protein